jgi:hypothetical protein
VNLLSDDCICRSAVGGEYDAKERIRKDHRRTKELDVSLYTNSDADLSFHARRCFKGAFRFRSSDLRKGGDDFRCGFNGSARSLNKGACNAFVAALQYDAKLLSYLDVESGKLRVIAKDEKTMAEFNHFRLIDRLPLSSATQRVFHLSQAGCALSRCAIAPEIEQPEYVCPSNAPYLDRSNAKGAQERHDHPDHVVLRESNRIPAHLFGV